ncbi:hypothetical protein HN51_011616 [Arachis hypogaea]|nr:uncharacterized protein DS421_3g78210 [Arachis hypogaea]
MDVEDAQSEVSISSGVFNSAYSQQNEVVSPEDLAWIDSCLTEDLNVPESSWIHVKNALLEIISSQPQSFYTGIEDTEIPPSAVEINQKSSTYHVNHSLEPSSTSDVNPLTLAAESSANENLDSEERVTLQSLSLHGNPFRQLIMKTQRRMKPLISELIWILLLMMWRTCLRIFSRYGIWMSNPKKVNLLNSWKKPFQRVPCKWLHHLPKIQGSGRISHLTILLVV